MAHVYLAKINLVHTKCPFCKMFIVEGMGLP
jgi:hypothetical protein